jgi:hypothetical protein
MFTAIKFILSAAIIVAVTEISKRSTVFAALIITLPLVSILSFIFIYVESKTTEQIIPLSYDILWMGTIPSLVFFLLLPHLLKAQMSFWAALPLSCIVMIASYGVMMWVKSQWFS